ncbi:MAG: hypothetical protein K8R77_16015 [Anaerolineaceae bacterium]|nr:hypothetical protein [Anaerolineaceae bacterium]
MTDDGNQETAREIIDHFFSELKNLEGVDQETANIIQTLWNEEKLGKDELMTALETARKKGADDEKEA